ncbi:uncharacterized protein LOC121467076 [Drosophila elegans]|uniref:uncharacterized protein LOC121467076 n=1 Tax=Drosophila elegans TaxID=30023 RepID=UPI001BC82E44|nr:uncharacterized protein LOC121467076 [Drosophila elegans]
MRRNRARRKNLHKPPKTVLLGMRQKWNKNNGMLPSWNGKRQRPEQVTLVAQDQKQIPATEEQLSCDGFQIFATVKIGPVKAKGTVDTGASRSVISKRRYNELRKYGKWRKERTEITLANGSKQRSDGDFTTNIQFAGEEFELDFLILNQVTGGILLGIDFLAKTRTRIQCGNLELDITEAETTQGEIEPEQSTDDTEPTEEEISKFLEQQRKQQNEQIRRYKEEVPGEQHTAAARKANGEVDTGETSRGGHTGQDSTDSPQTTNVQASSGTKRRAVTTRGATDSPTASKNGRGDQ